MTYSGLASEAEQNGCCVFERAIPESKSCIVDIDGTYCIAIDNSMTAPERLVHLGHEYGHAKTGALYYECAPQRTVGWCEGKAKRYSYRHLLPFSDLAAAIHAGLTESWQLAEHFGLTEAFVIEAINYYTGPCGLNLDEEASE